MNRKTVVTIIVISLLGIGIGILLNSRFPQGNEPSKPSITNINEEEEKIPVDTPMPTPTLSPYLRKITSISSDKVILVDEDGNEITLFKNAPQLKISVFRRSGANLVPATVDDFKVGQSITIVNSGNLAVDLIIEQ